METNIQIFTSENFGDIRTCQVNNQIMFVGKDVATALGYSNSQKAIRDHVDDDDKLTERFVLSGQIRSVEAATGEGVQALGDLGGAANHPQDGQVSAAAPRIQAVGREG